MIIEQMHFNNIMYKIGKCAINFLIFYLCKMEYCCIKIFSIFMKAGSK